MRIVRFEILPVDGVWRTWVFVRLTTDDGIQGLGEATVEGQHPAIIATCRALEHLVLGRDPREASQLRLELLGTAFWDGIVFRSAVGAVEMACLDIQARALGVPVHVLLGGAVRDRIPCYTHVSEAESGHTVEERAEEASQAISLGWQGVKWDPLEAGVRGRLDRSSLRSIVAQVAAVRAAVGPEARLMLDLHGRLDPGSALRLAQALVEFDLYFLEEPVPPWSQAALGEVARLSPVPLATGERIIHRSSWFELLAGRGIEHAQPDVIHVGGLFEARFIGAMAEACGISVAPHNPNGPVATAAAIHLAATLPNLSLLEMPGDDYLWFARWRDALLQDATPLRVSQGHVPTPDRPGLGIELNDAEVARHAP